MTGGKNEPVTAAHGSAVKQAENLAQTASYGKSHPGRSLSAIFIDGSVRSKPQSERKTRAEAETVHVDAAAVWRDECRA
jgi:hypothetical protein